LTSGSGWKAAERAVLNRIELYENKLQKGNIFVDTKRKEKNVSKFFSIITINLNNDKGLERTIKSVISQKEKDYEFIIKDGKSKDDSLKVIEKYDKVIDKIIIKSDKGVYDAMNQGIEEATGKYIIFLNSGDEFVEETTLSKVKNHINSLKNKPCIFFGNTLITLNGENIFKWKWPISNKNIKNWLKKYNPNHQSIFISKDIYNIYKYNTELTIYSDQEFLNKLKTKYDFYYFDIDVAYFELGGVSNKVNSFKQAIKHTKERYFVYKNNSKKSFFNLLIKKMYYYTVFIVKYFLLKILGEKKYYKIIYKNQLKNKKG
jgi:glycosyltransferase involved in cell wall biosynthesis